MRGTRNIRLVAALGLAAGLSVGVALGAPGDVDRSFDGDGRATADAGGHEVGRALAVQPDGKIVVAGQTSLGLDAVAFRLNANGTPDASFDGDGARAVDSGGAEVANAVALQPDGKIVVAGFTTVGNDAAVYRLTSGGASDPSFDGDGARGIDSGGQESARAVALQPDGAIVVAGATSVGNDAAVYRLTSGGAPDSSFDGDGARGIDLGGNEAAAAVAVQPTA